MLVAKLEHMLLDVPYPSLAALPPGHEVASLVHRMLALATETDDRLRAPLVMSQKIVQHLYKTPSQLGREIYVTLLEQLCSTFEEVAKEAITWLIYAEDEVSVLYFDAACILSLFAAQIQRSSHDSTSSKSIIHGQRSRSAAGEAVVLQSAADSAGFHGWPHASVSGFGASNCY